MQEYEQPYDVIKIQNGSVCGKLKSKNRVVFMSNFLVH